ncbi:hypothetical protein M0R45_013844 [Rubus argutus]|uniref:Uncharacterized protein n=1 Tax=Rubus argutus TaxID=59490 RepID=A0AAW1XL13_RUBAR
MKENLGSMIGTEVNLHEKIYASPVLCTQFLGNDSSDSDHGTKLFVGNGDISDISHTSEAPVAICSQGDHLALLTAHSASDVNRSMDLLSAKLPKSASDKDLESRGKGTTTIAIIGEDAIFLATDRRITTWIHHLIVGTASKIFTVQARGQPVLATIAGRMGDCTNMLNYVRRKLRKGIARGIHSSSKSVHMAAFHTMNYIGAWELRHRDATFPARSIWQVGTVCSLVYIR